VRNWCLEIWGDYACFTRPEMKVERVSYDVITPSAARAIFESILWKPAISWQVTKIEVLNPIKWVSIRRNEVGKEVYAPTAGQMAGEPSAPMGINIENERQQRAGLLLKDVRYRLHGYFDFIPPEERQANRAASPEFWAGEEERAASAGEDEKPAKYAAMFERRAQKGQCFHRPYLGCREFACYFKLVNSDDEPVAPIKDTRDLGFMLYDMDYAANLEDPPPLFFRALLEKGVVNTDRRKVVLHG
jgi:CRISPR-associated protein Cas5d